ncbi:hypothetical protein L3Q82_000528 [Scortum barcoo]|uniref:Uncharacterized protein n=1 Tax=Scortum barcoo TaxID=214431 RepID=A0ACB8WEM2_9TELE|nr:hypothetical protein L3Q82_000528 [Scortum barcoo]
MLSGLMPKSRKTKVVNYCEAKDFDDDEDFASARPPPSKKSREDLKPGHENPFNKSSSQESNSKSTEIQKSRRPLDERLHERDLEAAITLSLLNHADGIQAQSPSSKGLDQITSEKESLALSRQRKAATKATEDLRKKPRDEDEDYEPKLTPGSESDEDFSEPAESEDEEFTVKKVSKTKKKEKVTKNEKNKQPPASKKEKQPSKPPKSKSQAAVAPTPVRSPPAAKPAPKRPVSSSTVSTSKPVFSLSPAGGRTPKWTPPGQIGRSPSSSQSPAVKSPGQGLRLGLSRLVRVKPLHPSVAGH